MFFLLDNIKCKIKTLGVWITHGKAERDWMQRGEFFMHVIAQKTDRMSTQVCFTIKSGVRARMDSLSLQARS